MQGLNNRLAGYIDKVFYIIISFKLLIFFFNEIIFNSEFFFFLVLTAFVYILNSQWK